MESKDTSRKAKRASPNLVILRELIESKAWRNLTGIAPQLYTFFLLRRQMVKTGKRGHEKWQCANSQEITFTYSEAKEKYEITQRRFLTAIDELIEKGFLDVIESASGMFKKATVYGLSERWRQYGTPQFKKVSRPKGNHIGFRGCNLKNQIQLCTARK